jgi:hypothetical protein
VIDEIRPISKWRQFGYDSPEQAAQDWQNLQPAHYCCNAAKSNKIFPTLQNAARPSLSISDGDW